MGRDEGRRQPIGGPGRRYAPLSERQVDILQWVADGCPDRVWPDFTHKSTVAMTLAGRGLVTVRGHGRAWRATVTDDGRYYLEHGVYRGQPPPKPRSSERSPEKPVRPVVTPESLLAEIEAAGGNLEIPDPSPAVRSAYRKAIGQVISNRLVPAGYSLSHGGRTSGKLWVELTNLADVQASAESQPEPQISVPDTLAGCHETVAAMRDEPRLLDVSDEARNRALLMVQAIAAECVRRGYEFSLRPQGEPSFQIEVGEDSFPFTLSEEYEKREILVERKLAEAKYAWQRIPIEERHVRSGRLILRLELGYRSSFWADRKRWTLQQKLPDVFGEVARRASSQAEERRRKEEARIRQRQEWEEATEQARRDYVEQLNRDRLRKQCNRYADAEEIRRYCARLDDLAERCADAEEAARIREWAEWARAEADRIDPVLHPEKLRYVVPPKIRQSDLKEFMPRGMNV